MRINKEIKIGKRNDHFGHKGRELIKNNKKIVTAHDFTLNIKSFKEKRVVLRCSLKISVEGRHLIGLI